MERGYPTLYYGTKQLYIGRVNFKFTGGGNHPLRKTLYKKKKVQEDEGWSEAISNQYTYGMITGNVWLLLSDG